MPDLMPAAHRIAAIAAKNATPVERTRRLDPDVVQAVLDAGFARHFVPARSGGAAAGFTELLEPVAVIGEACVSTAWYASLTAALGRMTAYLPVEGQEEIWAESPDPLVVGALMPLGSAWPADGGWTVSGSWPFVSAVDYSDWALVCAVATADGEDRPQPWFFAIPRGSYRIVDTWHTTGMRGTGSNTVVVEDVFVPASRACTRQSIADGAGPAAEAICHTVPMRAVNGLAFAGPMAGAARGALDVWTAWVAEKLSSGAGRNSVSNLDRTSYEHTLARSAGEIDAAQLLLERVARTADAGAVSADEVARGSRDCALAAELLGHATDRLFRSAGTRAQAENSPLQRYWRDTAAIGTHIGLQFGPAATAWSGRRLTA